MQATIYSSGPREMVVCVEVEGDPQFALHFLDLRLVVNFVCSKRAALQKQREIWMPLCLPRFNARVRTTTRFSKLTF